MTAVAIIALVLAVITLAAYVIEKILARPQLRIEPAQWPHANDERSFAVARVRNAAPPRGFGWVNRAEASHCQVKVQISQDDRVVRFAARWSSNAEPFSGHVVSRPSRWSVSTTGTADRAVTGEATANEIEYRYDLALAVQSRTIDLPASAQGEEVPVAIMERRNGEVVAFGFSSESYAYPAWANPEWGLVQGHYDVELIATSGVRSVREVFHMQVGTDPATFRLDAH